MPLLLQVPPDVVNSAPFVPQAPFWPPLSFLHLFLAGPIDNILIEKKMILGLLGSTAVYQIIYYVKKYFLVLILDHTSSKKIMLKYSTSTTFDVDIRQEYIPCCKLIFFYTDKNYY